MKSILEQIYFGNKFAMDKVTHGERSKENLRKGISEKNCFVSTKQFS